MNEEVSQNIKELNNDNLKDEAGTEDIERKDIDGNIEIVNDGNADTLDETKINKEIDKANISKNNMIDYLDPSILEVKSVTEDELLDYEDKGEVVDDLSGDYENTFADIKQQEVVPGTVVGINDRDVLIDIGFKAEGIVSKSEFPELPEIGQVVDVFIRTFEDRKGNILLSKEKADFHKRWQEIRDCFEKEELITGLITRRIKGGMVVDLGVVQAFLPGSQLDIKPVTDFDEYLGVESEFKIVKFNELRQNIVLSRKAILEGDLLEKRQAVLTEMEIGMVLEGIVKNITDFGAFIDLGGVDGLLHITDITWGRINHPSEKLELGETITVKVIDFDVEKVRVSLGMKQLLTDPWSTIGDKYPIDKVVEGKIVSLMNYGVFVELEEGVEGLIHISEMSWIKHIKHPSDLYKTGDTVSAKILNVEQAEKKISMGIKQLQDNPWDEIEAKYPVGSDFNGTVRNLTQFGAFIELEEGVDGLVHISDISWTVVVRHPKDVLAKGDEVKVRVLEVCAEERRLSLGIKQLEDDPWDKLQEKYSSGKVIKGEVIKVLDKGIIYKLEDGLEGIVPLKKLNKEEKAKIIDNFKEGDVSEVTVQQVDSESKKIILMSDQLGLDNVDVSVGKTNDIVKTAKPETDKIEVPQDVIDKISEVKKK